MVEMMDIFSLWKRLQVVVSDRSKPALETSVILDLFPNKSQSC